MHQNAREHPAILSTFVKLPVFIKTFVLSGGFCDRFTQGFTVRYILSLHCLKKQKRKKDEANGENELLAYPTFSHFSILLTFFKSVSFKSDA